MGPTYIDTPYIMEQKLSVDRNKRFVYLTAYHHTLFDIEITIIHWFGCLQEY